MRSPHSGVATDALRFDGKHFRPLLDRNNNASQVWAHPAYRSKSNEAVIASNGFQSKVHFKKPRGKPLSEPRAGANAACSWVRSKIEHVFGAQKAHMSLFIRTFGHAQTEIWPATERHQYKEMIRSLPEEGAERMRPIGPVSRIRWILRELFV